MAKMTRPADLDAIDRLEEKVKLLVEVIGRMRGEESRVREENLRLARELETAKARLAEAEGAAAEFSTLKEEREVIRSRVADMLQQIEALNLSS
jgi:regulator of replication initiation timing